MKLSMTVPYARSIKETADLVVALEQAGLDLVLVPESYSFDAVSAIGYLAARTTSVQIGTGILNVYSRTPALLGMTAAGCDFVSDGRFFLGLGASGPQVIEGFHAVPHDRPVLRTRECIDVVRRVLSREVVSYDGRAVQIPLPDSVLGKPLKLINHPVRSGVPIWWASLMPRAVEATAEVADGWLPIFFVPELADRVWGGPLRAGLAKRLPELAPLHIAAGGPAAVSASTDVIDRVRGGVRQQAALYIGGMGSREKNFYNTICRQYGWVDEAQQIQDLYLDGKKDAAAAVVPDELVDGLHLCGDEARIADRVAAFREAGVTVLTIDPVPGVDPVATVAALRTLVDA